ncbi:MAG: hypothetical protein ABIQ31_23615 [Ferruginibacter sp.]
MTAKFCLQDKYSLVDVWHSRWVALLIVFLTGSFRAITTAVANPVNNLRTEKGKAIVNNVPGRGNEVTMCYPTNL